MGHAGDERSCRRSGSATPTRRSRCCVRHLICACTGLPRQDLEWLFEYEGRHAGRARSTTLATMQPTSKFGELFQYSNPMAGAAGFTGGPRALSRHGARRRLRQGDADAGLRPARHEVDDLRLRARPRRQPRRSARARRRRQARARGDGASTTPIIPLRPAGAAWSNVRDMLRYVSMELAEGKLPDGKQYIPKEPLLERRVPQVAIGKDETYGMGLMVDTTYGVAGRAPRRRHDRLPQRHDLAARAERRAP